MSRKEEFLALVKKHGYRSINHFCIENDLIQTNVNKRIKDENIKVDLLLLFNWAAILNEPIDTLLNIFYPEEMENNRTLIEK